MLFRSAQMALQLSDVIKERVKAMKFRRHRVICNVMIGENVGQCFQLASRCIWDAETDNYVTSSYKNGSLFAIATVFAVYLE